MAKPTNAAIVDLKGRKWDPFATDTPSGYVTYTETEGEIHVPYGADPVSLMIQAHELAHVRYSAKVWPNLKIALSRLTSLASTTNAIVGYAEDMRIAALAGRLGIKTLPEFGDKLDQPSINAWVKSFVDGDVPEVRAQKAIRFILNDHTKVVESIGLDLTTLQQRANAERYIVHCARYIHELLSHKSDSDGAKSDSSDKSKGKGESEGAAGDEQSEQEKGDADGLSDAEADDAGVIDLSKLTLPDVRQAMLKSVPAPVDTEKLIQTFQHTLDTADWIPVTTIDRKPLVRRAAQATRKGRKLSETGVALGSAYDAVSPNERRPFVAKRKGGAGGLTVLIDCSGSMRIQDSQLEQLLLNHPQGVVVTYSSRASANTAVVRVIASHGRLAATKDFRDNLANGNGCDGPVLEWLAKQSGERVWVCDGIITGACDRPVSYDWNARDAWLKAHRIKQFDSLDNYLESLSKR